MKRRLLAIIATLTSVIAAAVASSACYWMAYQPQEPKCLRED